MPEDAPTGKKPPWKSTKNWGVLLFSVVVVLNRKFGLGLEFMDLAMIGGGIAALLGIEGFGDVVSRHHTSRLKRDLQRDQSARDG